MGEENKFKYRCALGRLYWHYYNSHFRSSPFQNPISENTSGPEQQKRQPNPLNPALMYLESTCLLSLCSHCLCNYWRWSSSSSKEATRTSERSSARDDEQNGSGRQTRSPEKETRPLNRIVCLGSGISSMTRCHRTKTTDFRPLTFSSAAHSELEKQQTQVAAKTVSHPAINSYAIVTLS